MSGLSRTPGKRVGVNSPPRVRIPLPPPDSQVSCGFSGHSPPGPLIEPLNAKASCERAIRTISAGRWRAFDATGASVSSGVVSELSRDTFRRQDSAMKYAWCGTFAYPSLCSSRARREGALLQLRAQQCQARGDRAGQADAPRTSLLGARRCASYPREAASSARTARSTAT